MVRAGSPERVEALNAALWIYDDRSFLPHGSAADGHPEDQPVWLAADPGNPNGAQWLVLADGATLAPGEPPESWPMLLEIFDGRDDEAVAAARARWTAYKEAGHTLAYWKQSDAGKWEKG